MVDIALFEQFLSLDADERREFVRAAQTTVDGDIPATTLVEIRHRLAEMGDEPAKNYVTAEDDQREVRARRFPRG